MADLSNITHYGLPGISRGPFGMHASHFYSNLDQFVATLAPYFVTGLRGKERCLWVTAPPLRQREALQALRDAWDGVDDAAQTGALRFLDAERLKGLDVVQLCLEGEERALAEGYKGLRIAGNTSLLASGNWETLMEYERAMSARFNGRRIVALCSYALAQLSDQQMNEVIRAHHCALEHPGSGAHLAVMPRFPDMDAEGVL